MSSSLLAALALSISPLEAEAAGAFVAWLKAEKPFVLSKVDTTLESGEAQLVSAITASAKSKGGLVGTLVGEFTGVLAAAVAKLEAAGEADVSKLYDEGVAAIAAHLPGAPATAPTVAVAGSPSPTA